MKTTHYSKEFQLRMENDILKKAAAYFAEEATNTDFIGNKIGYI